MGPFLKQLRVYLERREQRSHGATLSFLDKSRYVSVLIFVFTVAAIMFITYEGVDTARLPMLTGQVASVSIHASVPFSYVSKEQTMLEQQRMRDRVPPVYKLEFAPYHNFETAIRWLLDSLESYEKEYPRRAPAIDNRRKALATIVDEFNARGPYRASLDDVDSLLSSGDADTRRALVERCLSVLHEIYKEGTHDPALSLPEGAPGTVLVFQIVNQNGEVEQRPVQSLEDAMIFLRVNLTAESMSRDLALALFRIFRNGLVPNLIFDQQASSQRENQAAQSVRPVTVKVEKGQLIAEQGTRVTPEQYEMLAAQRDYLHERGEIAMDEGLQLLGRILTVLAMLAACAIYINIEDPDTLRRNGRLALLSMLVIANLAAVRLTYSLLDLDFFVHNQTWAAALPFCAFTSFAPIIVAILIDTGSAIFVALVISTFAGVIYGNRYDVQVITFLASIVAVHGCRSIRSRESVVRSATASGLVVCGTTLILGLVSQTPIVALTKQMAAGLVTGILTGVFVVGILPLLEALFRRTTDITLLELTDYNHPLLRLMQMESPGTYHHSLVVAQLAENAAGAIGANPVLARVCALYHDIGKTQNPEYFSENQGEVHNPHDKLAPEASAEIIRQHVADGVALARKHHLPGAVLDVIQQHHGTTLIRFFYQKAKALEQQGVRGKDGQPYSVAPETFRYPGPKPKTKEGALISLADAIEAASRSLKELSHDTLRSLIDTLVSERLRDGQLDESPLTLEEVAKARDSFCQTLLNMFHSRVAYPALKPDSSRSS